MNDPVQAIRVLIADDHPVTRAGIRAILESATDICVVGEAADGLEAQKLVRQLQPDILLLDLIMPGISSYEVEKWVRTHCPKTATLILTGHDRDHYLAQAIESGAMGYLNKGQAPPRLLEAIRRAARGVNIITEEQMARAIRWRNEVGERWEALSEREREVLKLMAQGFTNIGIAQALMVSPNTIHSHIKRIFIKLGVANRAEAVAFVLQNGLLEL